ncbi:MAG: heavy metal-binding domain-containing protein, partial [Burkholderiales bacterium]
MKTAAAVGLALVLAAAGAAGGYWFATSQQHAAPTGPGAAQSTASPSGFVTTQHSDRTGRQVLYWYDPMVPQQRFDRPGKSPFMDMELVPKYADEGDAVGGGVSIDPRIVQNLGVRTAEARTGTLAPKVEAVG